MKTVHKYQTRLGHGSGLTIESIPVRSKVVHFGVQDGRATVWVEKPTLPNKEAVNDLTLQIYFTGSEIPDKAIHRGTLEYESLVYHLYEV